MDDKAFYAHAGAARLASLDWSGGQRPRVTPVDRNEHFSFSPMLYDLATGTATSWEVAPTYEQLLVGLSEADRVVRVGDATDGDAERLLPFDHCVLAFGSQPTLGAVPGAREHAQPFYSAADATALKARLTELRADGGRSVLRVSVVGGGYIGVELAANPCAHTPKLIPMPIAPCPWPHDHCPCTLPIPIPSRPMPIPSRPHPTPSDPTRPHPTPPQGDLHAGERPAADGRPPV